MTEQLVALIIGILSFIGNIVASYLLFKGNTKLSELQSENKSLKEKLSKRLLLPQYPTGKDWAQDCNSSIQHIFKRLKEDTHIEDMRCLILSGHNGIAVPTIDSRYYITVIATDPQNSEAIDDYNELEVGRNYMDMISLVIRAGYCEIVTKDMPDDALLKRIYEYEGVKKSFVFYVAIGNNELMYGSFSVKTEAAFFDDPRIKFQLGLAVSKLQTSYKQYIKTKVNS